MNKNNVPDNLSVYSAQIRIIIFNPIGTEYLNNNLWKIENHYVHTNEFYWNYFNANKTWKMSDD